MLRDVIKYAGSAFKPPNRQRLNGDLLDTLVKKQKTAEAPRRSSMMASGCTIMSDGWDDVERNHLVNLLVGTSEVAFFDGTVKLGAEDHENATFVSNILIEHIQKVGPLSVIQVCTDTCSVMKAAWKLVVKKFPWVTPTPCGTHCLSLELKDFGKIGAIKSLLAKNKKVINRFWGRKRWGRAKLRAATLGRLGKSIGLYRAADTRFAGHVMELERVLRLKPDLQAIAVSVEYQSQNFAAVDRAQAKARLAAIRATDADDLQDEDIEAEGELLVLAATFDDTVKLILLDEAGFWAALEAALKVCARWGVKGDRLVPQQ
jgi:hypothetical protein